MIGRWTVICVLLIAGAVAQEPRVEQKQAPKPEQEHPSYKLDFVLKQLDHGKVVSTHDYTVSAMVHDGNAEIRTGNRVPVDLGGSKGINYVDVGFNLDSVAVIHSPDRIGLDIHWELSTIPPGADSEKLIRQVRVRSMPSVIPGKQTVVSSIDDSNSGTRYELDVTVTPES